MSELEGRRGLAKRSDRLRAVLVALVLIVGLALFGSAPLLSHAQTAQDDGSIPDAEPVVDGESPYGELVSAGETLAAIDTRGQPANVGKQIDKATRHLDKALAAFQDLDKNFIARFNRFYSSLRNAEKALTGARGAATDRDMQAALEAIQQDLLAAGRMIALDFLEHGRAVGVDRARLDKAASNLALADAYGSNGDYDTAMQKLGLMLKNIGPDLAFDLDLFEQGIRDRFVGQVVGMAYVISFKGQTVRESGALGWARIPGEPDNIGIHLFFPDTEIMVASVSKTVTAIGAMRAMQVMGISPDDSIAPYLPSHWVVPDSINDLTFRDLMTHRSGLNGHTEANAAPKCGSTYAHLEACIAKGIDPADKQWGYQNANYALFRILIPYMAPGYNPDSLVEELDCVIFNSELCDSILDSATRYDFLHFMRCQVFDPMNLGDPGVAGCYDGPSLMAEQLPQTLMYSVPGAAENGFAPEDHHSNGGGYGWYFSARELSQLLAYQRYSNAVLNKTSRSLMNNGYLGWMSPADYSSPNGMFGPYQMHGGDWFKDGDKEIHTCVVHFPQYYQVTLVINSSRGPGSYQCTALRDAYDAAWVAK